MKFALIISVLISASCLAAEKLNEKTVEKIVNTIYKIEGGDKTKWPYGIKSIKADNPRQVCKNTVVNNYRRWTESGRTNKFLDFLANRYCPVVSDKQGNINWKKNIRKVSGLDF